MEKNKERKQKYIIIHHFFIVDFFLNFFHHSSWRKDQFTFSIKTLGCENKGAFHLKDSTPLTLESGLCRRSEHSEVGGKKNILKV